MLQNLINMYDFTSWFHEVQESRSADGSDLGSYKFTVQLLVLRPQFLTAWAWFHWLPEFLPDKEADFPQSSDSRETESKRDRDRKREYEQRSKSAQGRNCELLLPMSKATYHYYAGFFWSPRLSLIMRGDDTKSPGNHEAGILGGHVGGCQPQ